MDYKTYINSEQWKQKREERLKVDDYKCVICKGSEGLSVHHLHYGNLGNEDVLHDLVTVCNGQCHRYFDDIERFHRYEKRKHRVEGITIKAQERKDIQHYGMENITVSVSIDVRSSHAQRADSRSPQQILEVDKIDLKQAGQNRRRL